MIDFKIDEEKCISCGLCAQECPMGIIEIKDLPLIRKGKEALCLRCQHCLAVCPTAALSILGKKPEDSVSVKGAMPKPEELTLMIKTRRSIRKYKDENVDADLIRELLETASYAPTGHNDNAVLFSILDDKKQMMKFRELVYAAIKEEGDAGTLEERFRFLRGIQRVWEKKGVDVIFRDAPHVLIASAPAKGGSAMADSMIALSYFELLANSYGLGVLWNGMIQWAINDISPKLRKHIGIPDDHEIGYVLLFGKPAVKYPRGIQSEGTHINRITLD
jgi:nitroreductase/NAD-dependent dihydropyrimidine dehydrogenase PreA subunit